jgi:dihydrofolate synthase/folylpolyglutamate synthase
MDNDDDALTWLIDFKQHGSQLGLDRITHLLKQLDNPQDQFQSIHITGTNGKGSVCQYVASILAKAGYETGVYISPHLEQFSERITINNQEISTKELAKLINHIKPIVEKMQNQEMTPTFFEITTALAFLYFAQQQITYAVIEVGLGGRYDATNVITPQVSVITNITLEHTETLGENVNKIAYEKAGIIKNDTPVVTATVTTAYDVIKKIAQEHNAPVITIDKNNWKRTAHNTNHQDFFIHGSFKEYHVSTAQLGLYQGENIALSIATIEQLQLQGTYFADQTIETGIKDAFNPGRMEIIQTDPILLLDGAHNPAGMKMLTNSLSEDFTFQNLIFVLGTLKDKAITKMLSNIIPLANHIVITQAQTPRACPPQTLKDKLKTLGYTKKITIKKTIPDAIEYSLQIADEKDMICISGSLYTIGEARSFLNK